MQEAQILLDLNLPKVNGREVLAEIKKGGRLRRSPLVILPAARAEDDLPANSCLVKRNDMEGYISV